MKRILAVMAAFAIVGAAALTPGNAQGVGVQVGSIGAVSASGLTWIAHIVIVIIDMTYVNPSDCRVIRQRTETPARPRASFVASCLWLTIYR